MTKAHRVSSFPGLGGVNENFIDNPQFLLNTRPTTYNNQTATGSSTGGLVSYDRWRMFSKGINCSVTQAAVVDGPAHISAAASITTSQSASAGVYCNMWQAIENGRSLFEGQYVTYSFFACPDPADVGKTVTAYLGYYNSANPEGEYAGTLQTFTLLAGWNRYSFTCYVPKAAEPIAVGPDYARLVFVFSGDNTSATHSAPQTLTALRFSGVQLELGQVLTPLIARHLQQEITRCQRFYQIISIKDWQIWPGSLSVNTAQGKSLMYPTKMRTAPTVGITSSNTSTIVSFKVELATPDTVFCYCYLTQATGGNSGAAQSATLTLDAEL